MPPAATASFGAPESKPTAFSVSYVTSNLSRVDDVLVYAHMDDVVYVNAKHTPYATHKLPITDKSFVHQTRVCRLAGTVFVVVTSDNGAQIFDEKGEQRLHDLVLKDLVEEEEGAASFCRGICAINSDRPAIIVGASCGKVFVLAKEASSKSDHSFDLVETLTDQTEPIHSIDSPTDGALLASSDDSGTILVRNPDDAFVVARSIPGGGFPATSIRFTPNNWLVSAYITGTIRIFRKNDFHVHAEIAAHSRAITALDVYEDRLVSVGEDTFLNVWEIDGEKDTPRFKLTSSQSVTNDLLVGVAMVNPKKVFTTSYDTTHLKLWVAE
ncbi:hypothetical protein Poli38472_001567 [Pythium oligandrum]|uniref:WD repeat-containing protein 54 beta-propeller domain-containing protein n=1 Tax=Pythium oligandrum TaxID=41045 RepID=A0A8K1CT70_PYTOL|nr:hypothetical protein Poli38472_001567 [Pythium oligandrum]|eukprot:TMW69411.1 hypothetical protein Poli38472_001567 [Pythium oligandrum]